VRFSYEKCKKTGTNYFLDPYIFYVAGRGTYVAGLGTDVAGLGTGVAGLAT
jgi:hypothetical protein